VVAYIGGFTAIFAATMGLVMKDIKRVVAYSTISQLGYMMLGLGVAGIGVANGGNITVEAAKAAVAIGIFHLFNHAFFKALLFLGSGSVNHATGTFDMTLMGGLRKVMPWTYATFLIASISLAGIWPFAGFWSKDEIVAKALEEQPFLFVLAIITVFMTAFYIFRVIYLTFHGEYKGGAHQDNGNHGGHHLHESPAVMVVPMVVLAVLAVFSGFWNVNGAYTRFMGESSGSTWLNFFGALAHPMPWISMAVAGLGILLAYLMYARKAISAENVGRFFGPLYRWAYRKWYFDELYENIIVKKIVLGGIFKVVQLFDTYVIDGIANGLGWITKGSGRAIRHWQTGQLQLYGLFIGIGAVAIVIVVLIFG
jgi:NADH-quinone oxidoreductase subunit L